MLVVPLQANCWTACNLEGALYVGGCLGLRPEPHTPGLVAAGCFPVKIRQRSYYCRMHNKLHNGGCHCEAPPDWGRLREQSHPATHDTVLGDDPGTAGRF